MSATPRTRQAGTINRLSVLTLNEGRAPAEGVLVDDMPGAGVHDGCRVKFGPDGKLHVTMGDAANRLWPRTETHTPERS